MLPRSYCEESWVNWGKGRVRTTQILALSGYPPNTVNSGSFFMRPRDGSGFSHITEECMRNSPMEISVTWETEKEERGKKNAVFNCSTSIDGWCALTGLLSGTDFFKTKQKNTPTKLIISCKTSSGAGLHTSSVCEVTVACSTSSNNHVRRADTGRVQYAKPRPLRMTNKTAVVMVTISYILTHVLHRETRRLATRGKEVKKFRRCRFVF